MRCASNMLYVAISLAIIIFQLILFYINKNYSINIAPRNSNYQEKLLSQFLDNGNNGINTTVAKKETLQSAQGHPKIIFETLMVTSKPTSTSMATTDDIDDGKLPETIFTPWPWKKEVGHPCFQGHDNRNKSKFFI